MLSKCDHNSYVPIKSTIHIIGEFKTTYKCIECKSVIYVEGEIVHKDAQGLFKAFSIAKDVRAHLLFLETREPALYDSIKRSVHITKSSEVTFEYSSQENYNAIEKFVGWLEMYGYEIEHK